MFTVVITEKGGSKKKLSFEEPEVTIGRVPGNDIVLPKGNVSKRHSRIVLKDSRFIVVDLKSTNGTYVNGRKITSPLVVRDGDKIYIGDFILTLEGEQVGDTGRASAEAEEIEDAVDGVVAASVPPPLPSRAPEPLSGEVNPTSLRSGIPEAGPGLPSRTSVPPPGMASPSVPPVLGTLDAEPEMLVERTQAQAEMPPIATAQSTAASIKPAPSVPPPHPSPNGRSARSGRSEPPDARRAPRVSGLPPRPSAMPFDTQDDLQWLMARVAGELDVARPFAGGPTDEARFREVEQVIDEKLGELMSQGRLSQRVDKKALARSALHEVLGFGPIDELLKNPDTTHIVVERFDCIQADQGLGLSLTKHRFSSADALITCMRRLCAQADVREPGPTCDVCLPNGWQVVAVFSKAGGPVLGVRRRPRKPSSLAELQAAGTLDEGQAEKLAAALKSAQNVMVVAEPGCDVAPLLGSLIESLPENDRVALLEVAPEVALGERGGVCLRRGEASIRDLLDCTRYLGRLHLVIHDLRPSELTEAVAALSERRESALASMSADSLETAFEALRSMGSIERVKHATRLLVSVTRDGDTVKVTAMKQLLEQDGKLTLLDA